MKQVLFIAHPFPPQGGGGVQRTVKFVKYLPEFGWQPTVVTTAGASPIGDPSLADDVPGTTPVVRVRGLELPHRLPWRLRHAISRWLLAVDPQIGWLPFAARRGHELLRQSWDAIYSTSAPYTDHLVALSLKRSTDIPWLADFRDPWLDNFSLAFATRGHWALCARLEERIVSTADRVLVVSEPMRQRFLSRYRNLAPSHFVTLPNGFDPADFQGVEPAERDQRFTLVYTGSLYGKRQSGRPFLTALRQALDEKQISPCEILVRFVGNAGREAEKLVPELGLEDLVEFAGYVPHAGTIAHQLCADALLLIIGAGPGSDAVLTGKIFEYLAAGKPILALIPRGAASDLLTEAQIGHIVPPDDVLAISEALAALVADWRDGQLPASPDPEVVSRYNRRDQARRLAELLQSAGPRSNASDP